MGFHLKEFTIYASLTLVFITYNLIVSFYPRAAIEKGLSLTTIGAILIINPIANLLCTFFLSKYMIKFGRKSVLCMGVIFSSISILFLAPIHECDYTLVIILSVISRAMVGISLSCALLSSTAILSSDYPGEIEIKLGRMEASIAVGLFFGPLIGAALDSGNLLHSLLIFSVVPLGLSGVFWYTLGELREYHALNTKIGAMALCFRPVRFYAENLSCTWSVLGFFIL